MIKVTDSGQAAADAALRALGLHQRNGAWPDGEASDDSWRPVDLVPLEAVDPPQPTILAGEDGRGLLYVGKRHLVTGKPEAGKSWLGMACCLDVIQRLGRVAVFVDFDAMGAAVARERILALGASEQDMASFWYVEPDRPFDERAELWWDQRLHQVGLVWFDAQNPGLELHGLRPNSEEDVAYFQRVIVGRFHRTGATTAVVDHLPKDPEAPAEYAINSQQKAAGVDVHLRLELAGKPLQRGGAPTSVLVRVMKDRPGGFDRSASRTAGHLRFTPASDGSVEVELDMVGGRPPTASAVRCSLRPTHLMERISRCLEPASEPLSQSAIEAQVTGNRAGKRTALRVLVAEGYVCRERDGQAWRHASTRPYRQASDHLSIRLEGASSKGPP